MKRDTYVTDADWNRFLEFSEKLETPFVVINLRTIKKNYIKLQNHFPYAHIFYAVKANPAPEIISLINELGGSFDIASRLSLIKCSPLVFLPSVLALETQ